MALWFIFVFIILSLSLSLYIYIYIYIFNIVFIIFDVPAYIHKLQYFIIDFTDQKHIPYKQFQ